MEKNKENLIDVSRLYTLKGYSEKFGIPYGSVYGRFNTAMSGRGRDPFDIREISGVFFIYVSPEKEKELLSKKKGGK